MGYKVISYSRRTDYYDVKLAFKVLVRDLLAQSIIENVDQQVERLAQTECRGAL
jgi:hypothetical protein